MNHMPPRDDPPEGITETQPARPDASVLRVRGVHRAAAEMRRGTPVLLLGPEPLVLLPAETAGARGLREMAALAAGPAVLLMAATRASAVLDRRLPAEPSVVALLMSPLLSDPAVLRSLADPTAAQMLPEPPVETDCPVAAPAAVALVKLARLLPAVLAAPARPDAAGLAARLDLLSVAQEDVLSYPIAMAADLVRVAEAHVPLDGAPDARIVAFRAPDSGIEHLAILVGRPEQQDSPLTRLHSECFTGDLLGSLRCDCGPQLKGAIRRMAEAGGGVLLYLAQEGRNIGLVNKLRAYALQDSGMDTVDANKALGWGADERSYLVAATMLDELGIAQVRLMTNNPDKVDALVACGVKVSGRDSHSFAPNGVNDEYLATKAERLGHLFG